MADYRAEILERLAETRAQLKKLEAALAVINEIDTAHDMVKVINGFAGTDLLGDLPPKPPTFNERVETVAKELARPFTVPDIEQKMAAAGLPLPNDPRKRIAMALGELEEDGRVERTEREPGAKRNVFVVKPNGMQLSR